MSASGWWHLLLVLAIGAAVLVSFTALLCFVCRPAWQRTLWQASFVIMLGFLAIEGFGFQWTISAPAHPPERALSPIRVKEHFATQPVVEVTQSIPEQIEESGVPMTASDVGIPVSPQVFWWPGAVWVGGIVFFLGRSSGLRLYFIARFRGRKVVAEPELLARVTRLSGQLGLSRTVRVSESALLAGPVAFGIFSREICLPTGFTKAFTSKQQEAILAHEVEHLRSHDPLWYAVCDTVAAVWWWCPLVWYARRRLHQATERAADEASLLVEDGPGALAESLVALGKKLSRPPSFSGLGIEGRSYRSSLAKRVTRLLQMDSKGGLPLLKSWQRRCAHAAALLVLLLCVLAAGAWRSGEISLASAAWAAARPQEDSNLTRVLADRKGEERVAIEKAEFSPTVHINTNSSEKRFPVARFDAEGRPLVEGNAFYKVDPETGRVIGTNGVAVKFRTKWFKVDIEKLRKRFSNGADVDVVVKLVSALKEAGADLRQPKNLFYNDRLGMLMVRGTHEDLEIVEKFLEDFQAPAPRLALHVTVMQPGESSLTKTQPCWAPSLGIRHK